jgi:hypothetical protein
VLQARVFRARRHPEGTHDDRFWALTSGLRSRKDTNSESTES